ncbi:MAG: GNAT family N-acetyltransferase [Alphaproteobacteria bacterium]|nr:GNAT family N-acetyltransferase [Alphaproteobacteria bacterium]
MDARIVTVAASGSESETVLARSGNLVVFIATAPADIAAAQRLRYDVFYREMAATSSPEMAASGRDFDRYDDYCDHMLVADTSKRDANGAPLIVGCYRLLRSEVAARHGGFYTSGEYDISAMLARGGPDARYLELGRSAVRAEYRTGPVMQFLWRGLVIYLLRHEIALMFGCASLPGIDPNDLKRELSFLHHFHAMPPEIRVRARPELFVDMNLMPKEAIDEQEALRELPPLIKGYVRAGASIGDGAVIDHQFGTTDVFIYFPVSRIDPRYIAFFKRRSG